MERSRVKRRARAEMRARVERSGMERRARVERSGVERRGEERRARAEVPMVPKVLGPSLAHSSLSKVHRPAMHSNSSYCIRRV